MKKHSARAAHEAPLGRVSRTAERFYVTALWVLAAGVVVAHGLGAFALRSTLWGANVYAFLPGAALPLALALLGAGLWLAARTDPTPAPLVRLDAWSPFARRAGAIAALGGSFLLFWIFREGHTLLGDGSPLTRSLPLGQRFHPYQPLTFLIHHGFYTITHGLFPGDDPRETARATVALSSALAGALFIPVAWALAREIARALNRATEDAGGARAAAPLVFLALIAQGYVQLYFGYVENYTFSALLIGVYLLAGMSCLRGAAPLALPGVALVLGMALDLSNVLLVPSFLVLVVARLAASNRRLAVLRDLVLMSLFGTAIKALIASVEPGYDIALTAWRVVLQALLGHGDRAQSLAYMFSGEHVRDFLNEQLLIGPAGSFLFVTAVVGIAIARARLSAAGWFVLVAGLVSLGGAWAATDLGLGYPRDWDLFAPSGMVFTAAALYLVLSSPWEGAPVRRWLLVLGLVALFHTVPWIALNTSFDRSFERFKVLPLGLGRTESAVGAIYLARGDTTQALDWFQRSLDAYPANNVAAFRLGQIRMRRGRYPEAGLAFATALRSRPDRDDYRFGLVDAIVRGGGPADMARAHLDTLLARKPDEPAYWAAYGIVCLGLGDRARAVSAFGRAGEMAPADSAMLARLRLDLSATDGYARAVREEWPRIAGD